MLGIWIPMTVFGVIIAIFLITQFVVLPLMGKPNCFQACPYKPGAKKEE
jgi:hypothetical protein